MRTHKQRKRVPYGPDQVFDLVADVRRYPEFIPWCVRADILSREALPNGRERVETELHVRFKVYRESFITRTTLDPAGRRIHVQYIDGPFKHLDNLWHFEENPDGSCTIDFHIEFEFRSRALQTVVGAVFGEAVRRMVDAFEARADALYGGQERSAR